MKNIKFHVFTEDGKVLEVIKIDIWEKKLYVVDFDDTDDIRFLNFEDVFLTDLKIGQGCWEIVGRTLMGRKNED